MDISDKQRKFSWESFLTGPFATIFASVITTFLVAGFFFKFSGPVPISVTQTSVEKTSTFDVGGQGKASAVPDQAQVGLSVREQDSTAVEAQKKMNQKINQVVAVVKKLGVDEQDIKTTNYSLYPRYDSRSGRSITGYEATATVQVEVSDLEKINSVIDDATAAGVNQVGGISFLLSDANQKEIKSEARKQAIEEAKQKAEELAKLSGIKLGKIINVVEDAKQPSPLRSMVGELAIDEASGGETQVEPGSTELTVNIILSYETL